MAEEPKWFCADEIAKLMEEVERYEEKFPSKKNKKKDNKQTKKEDDKQIKQEETKQFKVYCDPKFSEKYQDKIGEWREYYYTRESGSYQLEKSKVQSRKLEEFWPASQFLAFLLYFGKTQANITLDEVEKSLDTHCIIIKKKETGEIEVDPNDFKPTNGHFLWNEENVSYVVPTSDGNECPTCVKMIQLIHQKNKEIFDGVKFAFAVKPKSNKGKQAMNGKNKQDNSNLNDIVEEAIEKNMQVIFTGAPGTGKTYTVREVVKKLTDKDESRYKFVQFHPSYDYSDFVEGLRPVVTKDSPDPTFVRLDGTFKQFCRSIVEKELETFCSDFRDLSAPEKREKLKDYYNAVKEGTFQGEETAYYFLIDEINRADLSKVFGELMFGLEESYRGIENRFDTQYKNLKTYQVDPDTGIASPMAFDCFADGFFIPQNLYLIGTMNDIDRSVESFDFALRRRFRWIDVKANEIMESSLKAMGVPNPEDIARKAIKMNNCLSGFSFGLGEAYHIGPAYFKSMSAGEKLKEDLKEVFSHRIEPLLREYTRGQDAQDVEELIQKCKEKLLENKTQGGE